MENITIELDCAPGAIRPDDLLPGVLDGTNLEPENFEIISKFFGNYTFQLKNEENLHKIYTEQKKTIADRIKKLYESGRIRYGSW